MTVIQHRIIVQASRPAVPVCAGVWDEVTGVIVKFPQGTGVR
jgi:hypothetical protein